MWKASHEDIVSVPSVVFDEILGFDRVLVYRRPEFTFVVGILI